MDWSKNNATIVHPILGRIPFNPYWYQSDFLSSYDEPRRIVLKARQIGFSQVFALEGLYAAIAGMVSDATVLLVSRSQDLATNLLRYCYLTYNNLKQAPRLIKSNEGEMGFGKEDFVSGKSYTGHEHGSRIKSIPANRSTGRGFAASRVYLDEFAYAEYAHEIYQSISPSLSQGGSLTVGSTPNGVGNLFHELYISGADFTRFCVPWHDCPAYYTPAEKEIGVPPNECEWYQRERPKYTIQQWASEYECDFVASGAAVFNSGDVDACERGAVGNQPAIPGHKYFTCVDIGRRQDPTVINTFDITDVPFQRVKHERLERVPYPIQQAKIDERWNEYHGDLVIESNGPGDPVLENIKSPAKGLVMSAKTKTQAIQAAVLMFEHKYWRAKWTLQERKELILYHWDDKGLVQDCVMSLAVGAYHMAEMIKDSDFLSYLKMLYSKKDISPDKIVLMDEEDKENAEALRQGKRLIEKASQLNRFTDGD